MSSAQVDVVERYSDDFEDYDDDSFESEVKTLGGGGGEYSDGLLCGGAASPASSSLRMFPTQGAGTSHILGADDTLEPYADDTFEEYGGEHSFVR